MDINSKKVLFTATLVRGHIAKFHIPYLKWFKEQGWETWVAAKNDYPDGVCEIPYCDHFVNIDFARSPFSAQTAVAYRQLKQLFDENDFQLVHTHTPVGGVLTRLAARRRRKAGTKVLYTAHGFHFYDGAPLLNWILWFSIEVAMSHFTDLVITINEQDYFRAQKWFACSSELVHGVGVSDEYYVEHKACNKDSGHIVILAVGDLNKNKNQQVLLRALAELPSNYVLKIAGEGSCEDSLRALSRELGIEERVEFLGFRDDVLNLLCECDIFALASIREGLPVSLIEAMAASVPCVSSSCRGAFDLLKDYPDMIVSDDKPSSYAQCFRKLGDNPDFASKYASSLHCVAKRYSLSMMIDEYGRVYKEMIGR